MKCECMSEYMNETQRVIELCVCVCVCVCVYDFHLTKTLVIWAGVGRW